MCSVVSAGFADIFREVRVYCTLFSCFYEITVSVNFDIPYVFLIKQVILRYLVPVLVDLWPLKRAEVVKIIKQKLFFIKKCTKNILSSINTHSESIAVDFYYC
jgi:hypothetical protein